jgi:hypothetical protein
VGRDARDIDLSRVNGQEEYFLRKGWTGQITLIRFKKLRGARRGFSSVMPGLDPVIDQTSAFREQDGLPGQARQ